MPTARKGQVQDLPLRKMGDYWARSAGRGITTRGGGNGMYTFVRLKQLSGFFIHYNCYIPFFVTHFNIFMCFDNLLKRIDSIIHRFNYS
jgi:hypothetical protein